jgi:hypothetical protein
LDDVLQSSGRWDLVHNAMHSERIGAQITGVHCLLDDDAQPAPLAAGRRRANQVNTLEIT